jgi:erythritol kinase
VIGACVGAPVRRLSRPQPALAGAALVATVALGQYPSIEAALPEWVDPWLAVAEKVDPGLQVLYDRLYEVYRLADRQSSSLWGALAAARATG